MLELSHLTREFVYHDIITQNDLSETEGYVAFMSQPNSEPDEEDWNLGVLEPITNGYSVRVLVGSGHAQSVELSVGDHQTWVKLIDNPEEPVRRAGVITIL